MTQEEFSLWIEKNDDLVRSNRADSPCRDCPIEWHVSRVMLGECDGEPVDVGRARVTHESVEPIGRGALVYADEATRQTARRQSWRAYRQRTRGAPCEYG